MSWGEAQGKYVVEDPAIADKIPYTSVCAIATST